MKAAKKSYSVKEKVAHYKDIVAKEKAMAIVQNPKVSYAKGYNKAVDDCRKAIITKSSITSNKSATLQKDTKSAKPKTGKNYKKTNIFLNPAGMTKLEREEDYSDYLAERRSFYGDDNF